MFDGGVITWIDGAETHSGGIDGVSFDFITPDQHSKGPNDVRAQVTSHLASGLT